MKHLCATVPTTSVRLVTMRTRALRKTREPRADPEFSIGREIFQENTKYPALRRAEQDIKEYCESVDDEEERAKCYRTLQRLRDEERKAYTGIGVLENAVDAQSALERLEGMARELASCGGTKLMVDALAHLQKKQDVYAQDDRIANMSHDIVEESSAKQREVRARLRQVFDRVDTDLSGTIDIAEFRAAMAYLGKHIDGYMVAEICQALGSSNHLSFEEFVDIVDVEEIRSPESAVLRTLLHDESAERYADWVKSLC